ncbi:hypothetical protein RQP53_00015 [Paucibacter sp. APW11]|uniref:DUF2939 domain-containing protein n=1 Tax=Roseateles aquae TaxID=3077235 RepID=A0ABU3P505_9BURK|nr:hypothetical protein [Paucibacter sp. APW11]MDT8997651.1 hypothetical protein [Paucibacter sp. APW11]
MRPLTVLPSPRVLLLALIPLALAAALFAYVRHTLVAAQASEAIVNAGQASPAALANPVREQDFVEKSGHAPTPEAFITDLRERVAVARLVLEAVAVLPDACQDLAASIEVACMHASVAGSYADLKRMLADMLARHPRHLVLRGLRMQRRDGLSGTMVAELDLVLIAGPGGAAWRMDRSASLAGVADPAALAGNRP